ncbi:M24 family metallopeptidase [bacterium]|nr:M24 family metallopeptidase [bacterium]
MRGSNREITVKEERIRKFLEENDSNGLLISLRYNFAWATGGRYNHVGLLTELGPTSLLITKDNSYIVTNSIEAPRIEREEVGILEHYEFAVFPWYDPDEKLKIVEKITGGNFVTDSPFGSAKVVNLLPLRYPLVEEEVERIKSLGKSASLSMEEVCKSIRPGQTELEIAGMMAENLLSKGVYPSVLLVAGDERVSNFRHPIPTENRVSRYAMVVICAMKDGIQVAVTRLVHFGKIDPELRKKHNAVVKVDSVLIHNTKVGTRWSDILEKGIKAYEEVGYPDEWKKHHQGGPTGYQSREFTVNPKTQGFVGKWQPIAWNPSITGTKSEDTILVGEKAPEIITPTFDWPVIDVEVEGTIYKRPDILER